MPNGDPNWHKEVLPDLEAFFQPLAPTLEDFAERHDLEIDRYYHQSPGWTFRFDHPKGGRGHLGLRRMMLHLVQINRIWSRDDDEPQHRSDMSDAFDVNDRLVDRLETALAEMKKWKASTLRSSRRSCGDENGG